MEKKTRKSRGEIEAVKAYIFDEYDFFVFKDENDATEATISGKDDAIIEKNKCMDFFIKD